MKSRKVLENTNARLVRVVNIRSSGMTESGMVKQMKRNIEKYHTDDEDYYNSLSEIFISYYKVI